MPKTPEERLYDFMVLVKTMRDSQKKWFRTHEIPNLEIAKKWEKKVDRYLRSELPDEQEGGSNG